MDYEKEYKDAMERAKKWGLTHKLCIEDIFPELAESEDERQRRTLIEWLKDLLVDYREDGDSSSLEMADKTEGWIAYLEKQKPAEWSDTKELVFKDICNHLKEEGYSGWVLLLNALRNGEFQPKQEWSEEDEEIWNHIIDCAESRAWIPFNEISWLVAHKPQFHWKPSEQEKGALRTAIHVLTEERNFPKAAEQLQAILDSFDGKEARKDWKPTEEQMRFLLAVINEPNNAGSESCHLVLKELYEQLKTL